MSKIIDIYGTKVEVYFNEYNKKTKKKVEIPVPLITREMIRAIDDATESTDSGTFFTFTRGDIETTGMFEIIQDK